MHNISLLFFLFLKKNTQKNTAKLSDLKFIYPFHLWISLLKYPRFRNTHVYIYTMVFSGNINYKKEQINSRSVSILSEKWTTRELFRNGEKMVLGELRTQAWPVGQHFSTGETRTANATYADIWTRLALIDTRNFTTLIFPSTSILGFNLDLHLGQEASDKKRIITATIK